jgi:endonuclease/exonuclease/phosphatase (EEP) superfamily protein YafD
MRRGCGARVPPGVVLKFRIVSWNLLHTTGAGVDQVCALVGQTAPDLMLMQEAGEHLSALPARLGGRFVRVALPGRPHGLAAWSPHTFTTRPEGLRLQRGMIVRRVCQLLDFGDFGVANVHLSHGQLLNRRQLYRIAGQLPARAAILGDCNMVGAPLLPGWVDVGARVATHRMSGLVPLRLDRCFLRGLSCGGAQVLARGASDHHPLLVDIAQA